MVSRPLTYKSLRANIAILGFVTVFKNRLIQLLNLSLLIIHRTCTLICLKHYLWKKARSNLHNRINYISFHCKMPCWYMIFWLLNIKIEWLSMCRSWTNSWTQYTHLLVNKVFKYTRLIVSKLGTILITGYRKFINIIIRDLV